MINRREFFAATTGLPAVLQGDVVLRGGNRPGMCLWTISETNPSLRCTLRIRTIFEGDTPVSAVQSINGGPWKPIPVQAGNGIWTVQLRAADVSPPSPPASQTRPDPASPPR